MTTTTTAKSIPEQYASLTAFQRDILLALLQLTHSDEDSYGLAIKRQLEDKYESEINHGRLYPNLDELITAGLVERGQIDKRTNRYTPTEGAEELLRSHYAELDRLLD